MNDLKPRYKGEIHDCVRHGIGTYDYPGGVYSYDGSWENGNKHGKKEKFIIHGYSTYVGDIVNGEINGKGFRRWDDGRTYDGEWHFGEMHGKGKWTDRNGSEIYDGHFSSNKRHGEGKLQLGNEDIYEGTFQSHKFDGNGRYYRNNKFSIDGRFDKGTLQGTGYVIWNQIAIFRGKWTRGVPHGYGLFQAFDNSLQFAGKFVKGVPIGISEIIKVDIDKSIGAAFTDSPHDKKDKKDKKENKEVKKKNPTGKKVKEIVPDLTVPSGSRLAKMIILTTTKIVSQISAPIISPVSKAPAAAAPHKGGKKGLHSSVASVETPSSTTIIAPPTPSELTRKLIFRIKPISFMESSASTTGIEDEIVLGEAIPLWLKYPSLRSIASAWDRFPVSSTRFIDGKSVATGVDLIIENKTTSTTTTTSPHCDLEQLQAVKLTDGINALHIISPGELRGCAESLTVLIDFRLDAATIADNATSVSRFCVRDEGILIPGNKTPSDQPSSPHPLDEPGGEGLTSYDRNFTDDVNVNEKDNIQTHTKPDFTVIPILSLGKRLGNLDGSSRLELVLQVPTIILEETAEWEDMQRVSRSRAASVTDDETSQVTDTVPESPLPPLAKISPLYNEAMSDERVWTSCYLELRLSNIIPNINIDDSNDNIEYNDNKKNDEVTCMPGEEAQAAEEASENKMITEYTSLSKWAVDSINANSWHSIALTLYSNSQVELSDENERESEGIDLVLNGNKLNKGGDDEKIGIALAWLPEKSFFSSENIEPAKSDTMSSLGIESVSNSPKNISNSDITQASLVVRIGGSGFDGYLKSLVICTENDLFDSKKCTSVFQTWLQGYKNIENMLLVDYRLKEEARIEKEKQLAVELEKKTNELALTGKSAPPVAAPAAPVPAEKVIKKKKIGTVSSPGSPASPNPELTMPRDCIECTEIAFYCKGGRGEVDRVVIPPTTLEGMYVIEVEDAVSSQCLSQNIKELEGDKRPAEVVDMHHMFAGLSPDRSFKLQIVNEV